MKVVVFGSEHYPSKLLNVYDPPFVLYYIGNLPCDNLKSWAVIGSRRLSRELAEVTKEFASHLAKNGIEIISGFAIGADIAAHLGAIQEKHATYAVIATSIDSIYPKQNRKYVSRLLEYGGGIITETMPFESIESYFFAKRNRIVSGLSDAIFVTCAPEKSGTLVTVDFGLDLGLDIYVYSNDNSGKGIENLIELGAIEIKRIEDIYKILGLEFKDARTTNGLNLTCSLNDFNISDILIRELDKDLKN